MVMKKPKNMAADLMVDAKRLLIKLIRLLQLVQPMLILVLSVKVVLQLQKEATINMAPVVAVVAGMVVRPPTDILILRQLLELITAAVLAMFIPPILRLITLLVAYLVLNII